VFFVRFVSFVETPLSGPRPDQADGVDLSSGAAEERVLGVECMSKAHEVSVVQLDRLPLRIDGPAQVKRVAACGAGGDAAQKRVVRIRHERIAAAIGGCHVGIADDRQLAVVERSVQAGGQREVRGRAGVRLASQEVERLAGIGDAVAVQIQRTST